MLRVMLSAGLLLATFSSPPMATRAHAHANQIKTYPGVMCRLRGDDLRAGHQRFVQVSQFGQIGNGSNNPAINPNEGPTDITVVCPIVRQAVDRDDGVTVNIRFRDTGVASVATTRFCCQLHNVNADGTLSDHSDTSNCRDAQSAEAAGGPQFGDLLRRLGQSNADSNLEGTSDGTYMLNCLLPPGALLIDYRVREN